MHITQVPDSKAPEAVRVTWDGFTVAREVPSSVSGDEGIGVESQFCGRPGLSTGELLDPVQDAQHREVVGSSPLDALLARGPISVQELRLQLAKAL